MTILQRFIYVWLVIFLVTGLSGCGFHLKSYGTAGDAGFKSIKILTTAGVREDFLQAFTQHLQSSGIQVVDALEVAELTIEFKPTVYQTSIASLTRDGDKGSELIKMSQEFAVHNLATESAIVTTKVTVFRHRQVDATAVLASDRELVAIQQQMAAELALQIIDRINRAVHKSQVTQ